MPTRSFTHDPNHPNHFLVFFSLLNSRAKLKNSQFPNPILTPALILSLTSRRSLHASPHGLSPHPQALNLLISRPHDLTSSTSRPHALDLTASRPNGFDLTASRLRPHDFTTSRLRPHGLMASHPRPHGLTPHLLSPHLTASRHQPHGLALTSRPLLPLSL